MAGIDGELTPPDDSLRSELEAAFSGSGGGGEESTQTNTAAAEPAPVVAETASEATERARAADGKFVAKPAAKPAPDPKPAPEKVAAATDPNLPSTDATKASEPAAQTVANAPPAGWTAAEKAEWSKLPPAVQAAVSRRESDMTRGGQQWSEEKRRYETAIAPVSQMARSRGVSTEEAIQRLTSAQSALDRDPASALRWLAQSYGVDLATLAGQPPADGSSAQNPNSVDIEALVRRAVGPVLAPIQQRFQREEQRQAEMTSKMVDDFAVASGHEHFDAVQQDIMDLIPPLRSRNPSWTPDQVLQEAYDRAVHANPQTRQALQAARETAAEEARRKEAGVRATKARSASVSITGAPQGTAAQGPRDSLRDEIKAAMNPA